MANDQILSSVIQQDQMGFDPFAQARQQQDAKAQLDAQFVGGPMGAAPTPADAPMEAQSPQASFVKMLQGMGVDDKGLSYNDTGRMQLIGRLRDKFGVNYESNSQASSALKAFDSYIGQNPMDTLKKSSTQNAAAERTLSALMGMK